ncbi:MAG TPA: hypothetical protein VKZ53_29730 [Candidatus Angelobacter sp.]|nr:hypothetical protein [Candidatus Angelobacter sp.]
MPELTIFLIVVAAGVAFLLLCLAGFTRGRKKEKVLGFLFDSQKPRETNRKSLCSAHR